MVQHLKQHFAWLATYIVRKLNNTVVKQKERDIYIYIYIGQNSAKTKITALTYS